MRLKHLQPRYPKPPYMRVDLPWMRVMLPGDLDSLLRLAVRYGYEARRGRVKLIEAQHRFVEASR